MELCQGDNIPVFVHAHLQVVYYKCVKFHLQGTWTDGQTDGQGDSYIPPQTLFAGGIIMNFNNQILVNTTDLTPVTFVCPSQARTWISISIDCGLF